MVPIIGPNHWRKSLTPLVPIVDANRWRQPLSPIIRAIGANHISGDIGHWRPIFQTPMVPMTIGANERYVLSDTFAKMFGRSKFSVLFLDT